MDFPSSRISPVCRVPGSSSWSRLIERRYVDLPHPEGPMIAVTAFRGILSEIPFRVSVGPP
jgi:hypothetical protein